MSTEKSEDLKYELLGYLILFILILLVILIFKFFMFGLPSATLEKNKSLVQYYEKEYQNFEAQKDIYEAQKKESYYEGIKGHEFDEQWPEYFRSSEMEYKNVKTIIDKIALLVDKNSKKDKDYIDAMIRQSNQVLKQTAQIYHYPLKRLKQAKQASKDYKNLLVSVDMAYKEAQEKLVIVKDNSHRFPYSSRTELATILMKRAEEAQEIANDIRIQDAKGEESDVLALYDSHTTIKDMVKKLDYLAKDEQKSKELLWSSGKLLVDMEVKYFLVPERYSWNNYSEYGGDTKYTYQPIEVGYEQYKTLLTKENARLGTSLSPDHYVMSPMYILHGQTIFDLGEKWPSYSTHAEYWLKELYPKYYHKYRIFRDDLSTELKWVEVDEKQFYRHIQHFGMQIYSKPYGMFSNEVIEYASPPAMVFVDNEMYGSWQGDPMQRHWKFYPKYEKIFSPYMTQDYYSEEEYGQWIKSQVMRVDFYGLTHRYGTYSPETYQHAAHLNSHFVRLYVDLLDLHLNTVRYRGIIHEESESGGGGAGYGSSTRSAKSSGRSLRGGGPGGYGK